MRGKFMQRLYSQGILFKHQKTLPKLVVPNLEETCARYLETVKPLASDVEFENTSKAVAEFLKPGSLGHTLHARLLARSEELEQGWLIDWWNDYAYMGYRDPVVINVNYFFGSSKLTQAFADDKPRMNPAARAASIIIGAFQFRDLVARFN
jgi:carnitine O-acetyltransferase